MTLLTGLTNSEPLLAFATPPTQLHAESIIKKIKSDLHPGQLDFVEDQTTEIIGLSAGYGAGKTRSLVSKAVSLAIANQGFIGIVMEPTGPLIRDIFQTDFDNFLEHYEVPYTFRASPLPEYVLHLPGGNTKILCRSFENWTRCIGINAAWCLADEIDTVPPSIANKAFPKILGRLRAGNVRQFAAASTPEGFRWMWNTFGTEEAQQRIDRRLIRMKTSDNPHLPPDFLERLKANYDPSLLQAYLEGQFCNLTTGQVYDRFNREKHIQTLLLSKYSNEPFRVGVDFNIGNMSAVIGVRLGNALHIVDEITKAHDTDDLAKEIKRKADGRIVYVYPDASGSARSTNASRTDIQILESYGFSNQSPKANPPIRDRVASVQALLENGKGQTRLHVAPNCKRLIECLELQSYTDKGEPDKDAGNDHMVDALGYLVYREFSMLYARAGRGTGIRLY
ncbi:MAG: putative terminase large subunit [Prokaryotic dsDNA virus sp.]|nr:MAG: putative terminase large subunit [Prokaryotic dsDNA virus sp.]|tara:strand:+ start:31081 stop:32433 length:1353 start_codon:yes stop_codon:yes gene_type:complete